jgi:hypothetical protein
MERKASKGKKEERLVVKQQKQKKRKKQEQKTKAKKPTPPLEPLSSDLTIENALQLFDDISQQVGLKIGEFSSESDETDEFPDDDDDEMENYGERLQTIWKQCSDNLNSAASTLIDLPSFTTAGTIDGHELESFAFSAAAVVGTCPIPTAPKIMCSLAIWQFKDWGNNN